MLTDDIKHILIVEDSKDVQSLLASLLESEGYKINCASNGREAMEFLVSSHPSPGLILLDLMMPEMNGYEFRHEQEKHVETASIPVVVMTADGDVKSKAMKVGAKAYLKKPFSDIDGILGTVKQFFPG